MAKFNEKSQMSYPIKLEKCYNIPVSTQIKITANTGTEM